MLPLLDRFRQHLARQPLKRPRSAGVYVFVGMGSMATRLLETIDCPVVPAGMFALATTTDVVTGRH